jgi:uncharacterized protein (UPF0548 family)
MYLLTKPTPAQIQAFLLQQGELPFNYSQVGATHLQVYKVPAYLPRGYVIDHNRIPLGTGAAMFASARQALQQWRMFAMDWVTPFPCPATIAENTLVAILAQVPGVWSLNAARIIYVLEQRGLIERYGFAYGTLPDHAAQGEERFTVEWHHQDDSVWYDILAFSRPHQPLARLGYPLARGLQRRFAVASLQAMVQAVSPVDSKGR